VQQQQQWRAACQEELEALQKRQVYKLVNLPPNHKLIGNRWVLNQKMDGQKWARLVAKGYSQVEGVDYLEIFSPVICYESICLMFTLATLENWYITSLDVKTAVIYTPPPIPVGLSGFRWIPVDSSWTFWIPVDSCRFNLYFTHFLGILLNSN